MKRVRMKRWMSTGFVGGYFIALPVLILASLGMILMAVSPNEAIGSTPPLWLFAMVTVGVTLVVAFRLRMLIRARTAALAVRPPETENEND